MTCRPACTTSSPTRSAPRRPEPRPTPENEESMGRLSGRTAVITGAASGIVRASAKLFAAEGANMIIADRADGVDETAEAITAAGGKAVALKGDAGDDAFVRSLVARAQSEFGSLDVFWANAGISGGFAPLHEQTADYWAEILRVNLIGAFPGVKYASRAIPKAAGRRSASVRLAPWPASSPTWSATRAAASGWSPVPSAARA